MMKCMIIANGDLDPAWLSRTLFNDTDYIICADGGAKHLRRLGISPNVVLGDMDSISADDERFFKSKNVRFERFPPKKDDTDTALATDLALSLKPDEITYLGVTGSRLDHTLANIGLLLKGLNAGVTVKIINENNEIHLINRAIEISGHPGDTLSILPLSETVEGICLEGLEYPLRNATLHLGTTQGISNVFIGSQASISITAGLLLVIKSSD